MAQVDLSGGHLDAVDSSQVRGRHWFNEKSSSSSFMPAKHGHHARGFTFWCALAGQKFRCSDASLVARKKAGHTSVETSCDKRGFFLHK